MSPFVSYWKKKIRRWVNDARTSNCFFKAHHECFNLWVAPAEITLDFMKIWAALSVFVLRSWSLNPIMPLYSSQSTKSKLPPAVFFPFISFFLPPYADLPLCWCEQTCVSVQHHRSFPCVKYFHQPIWSWYRIIFN